MRTSESVITLNAIPLGRARRLSAIATWATADSFMRSLGRPGGGPMSST